MVDQRTVEQWTPPLDANALRTVLQRVKEWTPLDVEAVFDDIDTAIGNQPPPVAAAGTLVDRLRSHLKQLSDIAVADTHRSPPVDIAQLVEGGRPLRSERTPTDYQHAVGLARRLAFTTSDLIERLIEARYITGAE